MTDTAGASAELTATSPADLRMALADGLRAAGVIRTDAVHRAFRAVPRHLFAPEVPPAQAYADESVVTKRDEHGMATSSVSAPWLQAVMLEQAAVLPGMRCLEIGSGGCNAALLAELTGPEGKVTTVDIDPEIAERASRCLATAGYQQVQVAVGDAEVGVPDAAPFDRIIVTAGAWDVPPAWVHQLAPGGRLIVPLRILGLSRSVAFEQRAGHLASLNHQMCGFVPVQGSGARQARLIPLHGEDVGLRIDDDLAVDDAELRKALLEPRAASWSGVQFGEAEPFDGLFLWLATWLPGFCLLAQARTSTAQGLVDPSSPAGAPAAARDGSFAYHAFRETGPSTGAFEFGAYGHGPDGAALADDLCEQIRAWDRAGRPGSAAQIAVYPAGTPEKDLPAGRVIDKRHTRVIISWP